MKHPILNLDSVGEEGFPWQVRATFKGKSYVFSVLSPMMHVRIQSFTSEV